LLPLAHASVDQKELIDSGEWGYAHKRSCESIILISPALHNVYFEPSLAASENWRDRFKRIRQLSLPGLRNKDPDAIRIIFSLRRIASRHQVKKPNNNAVATISLLA